MPADSETLGGERPEITNDEARDALSRILASDGFVSSPQLQKILSYIVGEHLAGRADQIKAYSIAVDAMDRPSSFDPQSDPAVRVEMRRLRVALEVYYARAGADDPVHIDVPKGSYRPIFSQRSEPAAETVDDVLDELANTADAGPGLRSPLAIAVVVVVLAAMGATALFFVNRTGVSERAGNGFGAPLVDVLAFGSVSGGDEGRMLAEGVRHQLVADLSHFRTIRVRARSPDDTEVSRGRQLADPDYQITGSVLKTDEYIQLTVALVDMATKQLIGSDTLRVPASDAGFYDLMVRGVRSVVANIASPGGLLQSEAMKRLDQRLKANGSAETTSYECVVLFHAYDLEKRQKDETAARACLKRFTDADSGNSSVWAAHAFMLFLDWTKLKDQSDPALLDPALAAASKAIRLDPSDAAGQEYLGSILMAQGKRDAAIEAYRRAIERNPSKPDLHVLLGWHKVLGGDWEAGIPEIRKGVDMSPAPPGWMRIPMSVDAFRRGDYREALTQAEAILRTGDGRGNVLALAPAIALKDETLIEKYRTAFLAAEHADPSDPMREIRSVFNSPETLRLYSEVLASKLVVTN